MKIVHRKWRNDKRRRSAARARTAVKKFAELMSEEVYRMAGRKGFMSSFLAKGPISKGDAVILIDSPVKLVEVFGQVPKTEHVDAPTKAYLMHPGEEPYRVDVPSPPMYVQRVPPGEHGVEWSDGVVSLVPQGEGTGSVNIYQPMDSNEVRQAEDQELRLHQEGLDRP